MNKTRTFFFRNGRYTDHRGNVYECLKVADYDAVFRDQQGRISVRTTQGKTVEGEDHPTDIVDHISDEFLEGFPQNVRMSLYYPAITLSTTDGYAVTSKVYLDLDAAKADLRGQEVIRLATELPPLELLEKK